MASDNGPDPNHHTTNSYGTQTEERERGNTQQADPSTMDRADFDQLQARAEDLMEDEETETTIEFEGLSNRDVMTLITCLSAGTTRLAARGNYEQAAIADTLYDKAAEQATHVYDPIERLASAMNEGDHSPSERWDISNPSGHPSGPPLLSLSNVLKILILILLLSYAATGVQQAIPLGLLPNTSISLLIILTSVLLTFVGGLLLGKKLT